MGRIIEFASATVVANGTTLTSSAVKSNRGIHTEEDYLGLDIDLNINVGAGVESVTIWVDGSPDGTNWYPMRLIDMTSPTSDVVASRTFTADFVGAALKLPGWRPYVRLRAVNAGASPATITALGYAR